jgi:predicted Zn-dependent peptidase
MSRLEPEITTLKNGLRVISQHMKETEAVTIEIWTGVGSRHEKPEQNGISHFLEHMAFKGTTTRNAKQIAEDFDNIGGHLNAHTSREHTVFFAKVLKEDFEEAAGLLADILQNSIFDQRELELERNVVLQEIAMTNDTPDDILFDYYQAAAFKEQPIGRPILGPAKLVSNFTRENLISYIDEHYTASNLILSVAGNVTHAKVVKFAENALSSIKKGKVSTRQAANYNGGEHREKRELEQVHLVMGFQGLSYLDESTYDLQLLSCVLGGGMSSRLFQEIRENRGLAYTVSSFHSNYHDTGTFSVYSATSPDKVGELVGAVCNELKKATDSITEAELKKAKSQFKASILMSQESSSTRADTIGRRLMCYGRYISTAEILEKINAVKVSSLSAMMERILTTSKPTVAAIGDLNQLESYDKIAKRLQA